LRDKKKIKLEKLDNIRHRIDLVRIEEGHENLIPKDEKGVEKLKEFIIGLNAQETTEQYQAQIEVNPYQNK